MDFEKHEDGDEVQQNGHLITDVSKMGGTEQTRKEKGHVRVKKE